MNNRTDPDRRDFVKTAAAGLLILKPATVFGSQANSAVEVGLIGCGGRGNWLAPFFPEYTGARIVALADVVQEHLDSTGKTLKVDGSRAYYGPEAYKELAHSKLDAVIIETPPIYHPLHAEEAVKAGKHVFCAKPIAVDVPGCQSFQASGKQAAQKNLSFWADFQTRAQEVYQEAAKRVHQGDIGKPAFAQVLYYAGRPVKDRGTPGMDPGERRLLNFFTDKVLSGDIIVEQNIHVIDVANWLLQGHPLKATGTGGRTDWSGTPYDTGDAWDHFQVTYWYGNEVQADFSSNQLTNSFSDLCVRVFGIKGCADTHYGGLVRITGDNAWLGAEKDDTFKQGCVNNIKAFVASIRDGKPINNADQSADSNLTAILGRMAAYQQRLVTWEEMMKSKERLHADLKLKW
ncbi:MAG: Gfo/Idh/MocA family oxidoreductase [Bryobacteraceae bacterium]